ncbi:MAG: DUF4058 family protein [bacterium]|nr:DUF4058 family protein [bacterium]
MPITAADNQYFGVNAHLQSYYQAQGGWPSFHDSYIVHLQALLDTALRPFGYVVDNAASLQVREVAADSSERQYVEKTDVAIRDLHPTSDTPVIAPAERAGVLTLSIPEAVGLTETDLLRALAIREVNPDDKRPGRIVTWIEVLSPSNKPGGQNWREYSAKRLSLMQAGIVLVELDYLHKQAPVIAHLPRYGATSKEEQSDEQAQPYYIAVSDPRPSLYVGQTFVYRFGIDQPFPLVHLPLRNQQEYLVDFGVPYQQTFRVGIHAFLVDYETLPAEFHTYTSRDQARIRARMRTIADHQQELTDTPFPIDPRYLEG